MKVGQVVIFLKNKVERKNLSRKIEFTNNVKFEINVNRRVSRNQEEWPSSESAALLKTQDRYCSVALLDHKTSSWREDQKANSWNSWKAQVEIKKFENSKGRKDAFVKLKNEIQEVENIIELKW